MKKRLFTVLLMLVLCVGVLSITAMADGDPDIVAQGTCGAAGNEDNVTWVLTDDGTITISGTGAMANDWTNTGSPWYAQRSSITKIVVENGVTNIGQYAFGHNSGNRYTSLKTVELAASVKELGQYAFSRDANLTTINLENVEYIGTYAFARCTSLGNINLGRASFIGNSAFIMCNVIATIDKLGGENAVIEDNAFMLCSQLSSVGFKSIKSIGACAFSGTVLTSADLSTVESIGRSAFSSTSVPVSAAAVTTLTEVKLGNKLTEIKDAAFSKTGIQSITLPNSLVAINMVTFQNCASLTKVNIPKSVLSIGQYAFDGCTALTTINYDGTQQEWEQITVGEGNDPLTAVPINFNSFADEKPTVKAETEKKTGKIKLTITAVDGAKSYKILVSEQPNGTYTEAATVTGTAYTYSGTPGKTYYFKVQAVNDKGELSGESNIVSKVQLPAQVTGLKATSKKKQVTLKWKKVTGAKKYVIYMSKNGKSGWKKVGTATKTTYVYKKGTVGKKLYFKVQAITANGKKGEFSKVVSIKVKK